VRDVRFDKHLLGSKINDVRGSLSKLTFNDLITVIALQQGIGKTHMFIEYANKHWKDEKIILASPRHNHLTEVMKELPTDSARHWWGFAKQDEYGFYKGCPKLNKNIPLLNELKGISGGILLSPKFVCGILRCNKETCSYHQTHIESNKIDLMPIEYLGTDMVLQQNPDIVFIDESIEKTAEYRYDTSLLSECAEISQNYNYKELSKNLISINPIPKISSIQSIIEDIEKDRDKLISELIERRQFTDAVKLNNLNSTLNYLKYSPSYDSGYYYRPKIYDVFDLAYVYNIRVVLLNASFNEELFSYLLKTYDGADIGDVTIPIFESDIVNPESVLLRMYPNNYFWKGAFKPHNKDRTLKGIFRILHVVEKYIPKERVGIITYQKIPEDGINLDDEFKLKGYDTLHFWAESGLNIMKNKYVLFIIGTPFIPPDNVIKLWEEIYNEKTDLEPGDIGGEDEGITFDENGNLIKFPEKGRGKYEIFDVLEKDGKEYDFRMINKKCLYQIIDSIHRCRPLTHDRIIIALGNIPAKPELRILDVRNNEYFLDETINYFISIKQYELDNIRDLENEIKGHKIVAKNKIRELLEYVLENKDYMPNGLIARVNKLWNERRNPDASFIKKIEDLMEEIDKRLN